MIKRPSLIIDSSIAEKNIEKMLKKALISQCVFRPHFKTHQSVFFAELFRSKGIEKITVSSVKMAKFFIKNNWKDITIAFPLNILEINEINSISKEITLNILIDSYEKSELIYDVLEKNIGIWIELDTGYHRSGMNWNNIDRVIGTMKYLKAKGFNNIKGILVHCGQSYQLNPILDKTILFQEQKRRLIEIQKECESALNQEIFISYGDTPTLSINDNFSGLSEIRPGNFIFYDLYQYFLGSCEENEIAVSVACPITAFNHDRSEIIIYGGAVSLSKEFVYHEKYGNIYGYISRGKGFKKNHFLKDTYIKTLSQEHGIIQSNQEIISRLRIGDILHVIPVHSCLTVDCFLNKGDLYII